MESRWTKEEEAQIARAKFVAVFAHSTMSRKPEGRFRKYTGQPYWVHPFEVGNFVAQAGGTVAQVCVGILHDVKEDTFASDWLLLYVDPTGEVLDGVNWLTDKSKPSDGNRKTRKDIDRVHASQAPPKWKSVKAADLSSNSWDIRINDPRFATKAYLPEKIRILEVIADADLPVLWQRAAQLAEY